MSKLHDILCSLVILNNEDRAIIEPQIKALMLELIGKDHLPFDGPQALLHPMAWYEGRDAIKAELRRKVAEL